LRENRVVSGQIFMIGGRHISAGIDVIGQMVSQFFWRIADLGTERALDLSEHTILALAIFAVCMGLVRCIRTAFR